jgi:hypothetical protein
MSQPEPIDQERCGQEGQPIDEVACVCRTQPWHKVGQEVAEDQPGNREGGSVVAKVCEGITRRALPKIHLQGVFCVDSVKVLVPRETVVSSQE